MENTISFLLRLETDKMGAAVRKNGRSENSGHGRTGFGGGARCVACSKWSSFSGAEGLVQEDRHWSPGRRHGLAWSAVVLTVALKSSYQHPKS